MYTRAAHGTATKDTMALRDWRAAVLEIAGVSEADADRIVTRERIVRWYDAGEPVWMAAGSLKSTVRIGLREERADREADGLRADARASLRIEHCTACGRPTHPTESTDDGVCADCL